MNEETALISPEEVERRKQEAAILKAVGMDRIPPEQRTLLVAIARTYDLRIELKHLAMVDGRPFITRDGLLWIAHRSGQLDGIEVTEPTIVTLPGVGEFWRATATVYRKDMSRPFTFPGRYPTKGGNVRYGPEMAVKTAESHALRRAFNVAVATVDEAWDLPAVQADVDAVSVPQQPPRTLSERVQDARQAAPAPAPAPEAREPESVATLDPGEARGISGNQPAPAGNQPAADEDDEVTQSLGVRRMNQARYDAELKPARPAVVPPPAPVSDLVEGIDAELMCGDEDVSPMALGFCELLPGHKSAHKSGNGTWPILRV